MAALIERRRSAAATWSRRLGAFAAMLFAVAGLGHRYRLLATEDFIAVAAIVLGAALLALLCAGLGLRRLWRYGDRAGRDSTVGLALSILVLAPYGMLAAQGYLYPPLTDISTDTVDPPPLVAAAAERGPLENAIAPFTVDRTTRQREAYPEITGRRYEAAPDRIVELALAEMALRGWQVRGEIPEVEGRAETIIEAEAFTWLLRYPADIAIRTTDEGTTTYVDMRSSSRYGRHDFGDNARRIADFLAALDTAVRTQPLDQTGDQDAE